MVTFPLPVACAAFETVQRYVPKSSTAKISSVRVSEFSGITPPVLTLSHTNVSFTSGLVLVTLQNRVIEPPRLTRVRDAITETSGGTEIMTKC